MYVFYIYSKIMKLFAGRMINHHDDGGALLLFWHYFCRKCGLKAVTAVSCLETVLIQFHCGVGVVAFGITTRMIKKIVLVVQTEQHDVVLLCFYACRDTSRSRRFRES